MITERTKKEFKYKGKSMEELQKLDVREFAKILPARARRSVLRNFQEVENFISRAKKKMEKNKAIKTHSRDIVIVPQMIGMKIGVHDGRGFTMSEITGEMLGHKFGEFSPTRVKTKHGGAGVGGTKSTKAKAKH